MAEKLTTYDPAEDLSSNEAIASFMAEALATNDASYIAHALGVVARAKGMAQIARDTGLGRESLYKALAPGAKPRFDTIIKVARALGVRLSAHAA